MPWDLGLGLPVLLLVYLIGMLADWPILRAFAGAVSVAFVPGYLVVVTLYPERRTSAARGASSGQRAALGVGTSLALVGVLAMVLHFIGVAPSAELAGYLLAGWIAVFVPAAWIRWAAVEPSQRRRVWEPAASPDQGRGSTARRLLGWTVALAVATSLLLMFAMFVADRDEESFTNLYVLGADGEARCYPERYEGGWFVTGDSGCAGDPGNITIGVVNREGRDVEYEALVTWQPTNGTAGSDMVVDRWYMSLSPTSRSPFEPGVAVQSERNVTLIPPPGQGPWKLQVELFVLDGSYDRLAGEAVRYVHLWVVAGEA